MAMNQLVETDTVKATWRRAAGTLVLALALTGCGGGGDAEGVEAAAATAAPAFVRVINVEVQALEARPFEEQIRLTGVAWANRDVQVAAEESGTIAEIFVDRGASVSAGQRLFRIDDQVLRAQVNQARAQAELAQQTWERRRRLYEEDRVGSELAYLEARSLARQTQAALESLEARLARTTIRAPFAGILDQRMIELGTHVTPGTPVARLVDLDPIKVVAGVPERYAGDVRRGGPAVVLFRVLGDERFGTTIDHVGSTVNAQNRTFPIEIRMGNPRGLIKPEMVANILVERRAMTDAVVVPQDALVRVEDGYVVFVAEESEAGPVARVRPVELGPRQNDEVVVESGVEPGDRLVVVGQRSLADGDRINVVGN